MPYITIDNRAPSVRFQDGNGLSDGVAAFQAAVLNAGPAAAQIRQQRERDSVAQAFQQAQGQRADRALDLQANNQQRQFDLDLAQGGAYHGEDPALAEMARRVVQAGGAKDQMQQAQLDEHKRINDANINNMNADNARASVGQFGEGMNETAKRAIDVMKLLFHGNGQQQRTGYTPITPNDFSGRMFAFDRNTGQVREVTPGAVDPGTGPMQPGGQQFPAPVGSAPTNGPTGQRLPTQQRTPAQMQALEKEAIQRMPVAKGRAVKTLEHLRAQSMAVPEGPQREAVMQQQQRLARAIAAADQGDPDAIEALLAWDMQQPDFQEQQAATQRFAEDMDSAVQSVR